MVKQESKKAKTKTVSHSNKNKNTVIVNIGSNTTTRRKKKGSVSFTKGTSYLGGSPLRNVAYPSPTIINNIPSTPMMMPQFDTNRMTSLENMTQNIATDIQHLKGKLHKPEPEEIKEIVPLLKPELRDIASQSRLLTQSKGTQNRIDVKSTGITAKPTMRTIGMNPDDFDLGSSTTTTPSLGGSSSSSSSGGDNAFTQNSMTTGPTFGNDSSSSSGGDDGASPYLPNVPVETNQNSRVSRRRDQTMSTIKEESIKQESNDNESTGSAETPMSALTSQFSRALTLGKSKQSSVSPIPSDLPPIKIKRGESGPSSPPAGGVAISAKSSRSESPASVNQISPSKNNNLDDKFEFLKLKKKYEKAREKSDERSMITASNSLRDIYSMYNKGKGKRKQMDNLIKELDRQFRN
jgi:hypothetical protein